MTIFRKDLTTRLHAFLQNWMNITNDSWVLNIIQFGYQLEFTEYPPLGQVKHTSFDPALEEDVLSLLQMQAIQVVPPRDTKKGYYSRYFTVPKKDGGISSILDLRMLNIYLHPRRF